MKPEQIKTLVIKMAEEQAGIMPDEHFTSKDYFANMGFDSLDTIEFIMHLEEEFDLEIPDDLVESFVTIGDVVDYVIENH